jgi:hypothetical protein
MQINVSVDINMDNEVRDMLVGQQWELLQLVWNSLEEHGAPQDWQSFYEENGLSVAVPKQEETDEKIS